MFHRFYGMRAQPFGVNPDPAFLYMSSSHREALASIMYSLESGAGFAGLVGEPGTGKTTLLFALLERYASSAKISFVLPATRPTDDLLRLVIADFGLDVFNGDEVAQHGRFRDFLLESANAHRPVIVILDEAQSFSDSALESVRLLSNFETPHSKLLHIILAGQPQLIERLGSPNLTQLRQRITVFGRLGRFQAGEIEAYILHRLKVAGYQGPDLFTRDALEVISFRSQGIPRLINAICFNALSLGFALQRRIIDRDIMSEVEDDLDLAPFTSSVIRGSAGITGQNAPQSVNLPVAQPWPGSSGGTKTYFSRTLCSTWTAANSFPNVTAPHQTHAESRHSAPEPRDVDPCVPQSPEPELPCQASSNEIVRVGDNCKPRSDKHALANCAQAGIQIYQALFLIRALLKAVR
jgi:general secretion pathway protein A